VYGESEFSDFSFRKIWILILAFETNLMMPLWKQPIYYWKLELCTWPSSITAYLVSFPVKWDCLWSGKSKYLWHYLFNEVMFQYNYYYDIFVQTCCVNEVTRDTKAFGVKSNFILLIRWFFPWGNLNSFEPKSYNLRVQLHVMSFLSLSSKGDNITFADIWKYSSCWKSLG